MNPEKFPLQLRVFFVFQHSDGRIVVNLMSSLPRFNVLPRDAARFLTENGLQSLPEGIFDNLGGLDWL